MGSAQSRRWLAGGVALFAALLIAALLVRTFDERQGNSSDVDVTVGVPSSEGTVEVATGDVEVRGYVLNSNGRSADLDGRLGELIDMIGVPLTTPDAPDKAIVPNRTGDFVPLAAVDPALADFVGSDEAFVLADGLRDRLILQLGCADAVPPDGVVRPTKMSFAAAIATVPSDAAQGFLRDAISAVEAADAACNSDQETWIAETRSALTHLLKFESALGSTPTSAFIIEPTVDDLGDLSLVTADVAIVVDRLFAGLTGRNPVQASNLWFSSGHLGHVRGLRKLLVEDQPIEGLVLGDSTAALGINPHDLSQAVGAQFANVAINGARLNVQIATTNQLLDVARSSASDETGPIDTLVWFVQTLSFIRACPTSDLGMGQILASQEAAFSPVSWLDAYSPIDRLLGVDAAEPRYRGTQIDDDTYRQFNTWDYGTKDPITLLAPELEANQSKVWAAVLEAEEICRSELRRIDEAIAQWEREGLDVIVLVPPISEDMAAVSPNGWTVHDEVITELRKVTAANGAELVDASQVVGEENFRDLIHIVEAGKPAVLDALVAGAADIIGGPST